MHVLYPASGHYFILACEKKEKEQLQSCIFSVAAVAQQLHEKIQFSSQLYY